MAADPKPSPRWQSKEGRHPSYEINEYHDHMRRYYNEVLAGPNAPFPITQQEIDEVVAFDLDCYINNIALKDAGIGAITSFLNWRRMKAREEGLQWMKLKVRP